MITLQILYEEEDLYTTIDFPKIGGQINNLRMKIKEEFPKLRGNFLIIKDDKVLVDCFATWCGPCRMLSPIIDALAEENKDYKFYKLDVDNSNEVVKKYGVMSIPTVLIFENGELKEKNVGFISKEELEKKL